MRIGIRELIFILLLLAVPAGAYFFVFEPRNRQIDEARKEIAEKQKRLQKLEDYMMKRDDLGQEIAKLSEAIDMFEEKLPPQREVEVVLRGVWNLAAKQKLTPKSIRTDKPISTEQYSELPIRMQIVGDFDGFYQFLQDIEKLNRITRLPMLHLEKQDEQSDTGLMQADMTLAIFFEGKAAPGAAGKGQR